MRKLVLRQLKVKTKKGKIINLSLFSFLFHLNLLLVKLNLLFLLYL